MTTTATAEAAVGDKPKSERVLALDVLRGIAILGTLASNVWIFTSGFGTLRGSSAASSWLYNFSGWLPNGKFLGLLTIMFGIGLEIQRQSALRAGARWPGKYPVRALLLFADGVLNYIFVVQFDVLRAYAVVGVLVAFLLLTSERVQYWLIGLFLTVHFAVMAWQGHRSSVERPEMDPPPMDPTRMDLTRADTLPSDTISSSYLAEVVSNIKGLGWSFGYGSEFLTILLMGLGLFLLGAKLYRIGIFTEERRRLRFAMMSFGFGVALPLDYLLSMTSVFPSSLNQFARYGAAAGVALGILALTGEYIGRRGRVGAPRRMLSNVGRMALSCYLLQNVLGVLAQRLLFNRPFFQQLDPTYGTYAVFATISALLIVFSWAWLRKFTRGPFELAWNWSYRMLTREGRDTE
ncbi:DUF418 domain-containing protein [Rhodococcus maanshanensis]|uniref:DUF418 domain-containing protein n=1 Tax=Rhodococcus maanshanensis TaxID=183556 RepID=A0A1H7V3S9_9NOCA|nr:DUF418 domain-containing protein [Rhodococcus maanshanensis]SEM03568.1 uncharacterized protein SAMN05444583_12065 [Rhodococcus maanshanensis]